MMDVMRQQPIKKKKSKSPSNSTNGDKDKGKNKETDQGATSFVQVKDSGKEEEDGGYVCSCCGSSECRLHRCPKKKTLPAKEWYKPEYAEKQNHIQFALEDSSRESDESKMVFSGAQIMKKTKDADPEVILDSGSTISLAKDKRMLKMCGRLQGYHVLEWW